jgi:hypothetical protein
MTMVRTPDGDPEATGTLSRVKEDGTHEHLGDFKLEPSVPAGSIPPRVVEELVACRREAKDYVEGYGKAIEAQAQKHGIKAGALKRYINAVEADKLAEIGAETSDLERLLSA